MRCSTCGTLNDTVDIGTNPQFAGEELLMFGAVHFPACHHLVYCPHLARRCATILEHLEEDALMPEDFCGLVLADHEPDPA